MVRRSFEVRLHRTAAPYLNTLWHENVRATLRLRTAAVCLTEVGERRLLRIVRECLVRLTSSEISRLLDRSNQGESQIDGDPAADRARQGHIANLRRYSVAPK